MSTEINNLVTYPGTAAAVLEEALPEDRKTLHTALDGPDSRPHILFIIDDLREMGGAERVLFKMIRLLPPDLFRCTLMTFRMNRELEEMKSIACPVHVLPLEKTYGWNALRVARQIRRFVREQRVAIVHTFFATSDLWAGPIARLSGCRILISSRRDMGILRSFKHRIAYRLLRRIYDSVLAVSPQVRDYCIQQDGLDPAKVQTLYSGLEFERVAEATGRAAMRRRMGIPETVPVVLCVGNIRPVKGVDVLVEAAALVHRKRPDVLFLIAGRRTDEEYCSKLESRIFALGLSANFRFLGSLEDVLSLLSMSDVFCLPSRSEGFSNALIEAMACGLPCVATDVGGNREVIQQGNTGFMVASEDHEDMAARLIQLLDDPSLAREMGLRGEDVIRNGFTAEAMMKELVGVYERLLAAKERN